MPALSGGANVRVYRGILDDVAKVTEIVRPADVTGGGILTRDLQTAYDAIYGRYDEPGKSPGVFEVIIQPSLWDELVKTRNIVERGYYGFSQKLNSHEIRVNSVDAARLFIMCRI